MKFEIKHRWTGAVLFALETDNFRLCVEAAFKARANLVGANLAGANLVDAYLAGSNLSDAYLAGSNLAGANLAGAYLAGADLAGADLADANLADANLADANLAGAYLAGSNLAGAYLAGADLAGADLANANLAGAKLTHSLTLVGDRPVLQIGPIGSRSALLSAYLTNGGIYVRTGCFFGTLSEFASAVQAEHGDNPHGTEYRAAIALIETHAVLWTPAKAQEDAA